MATFTPNYNLRKPAAADFVTVASDINSNMDTLDTAVDAVSDRVGVLEQVVKFTDFTSVSTALMTTAVELNISGWTAATADTSIITNAAGNFTVVRSGLYDINFTATLNDPNTTGFRAVYMRLNGTELRRKADGGYVSSVHVVEVVHKVRLTATDVITFFALQTSGVNVNLAAAPGHMVQFTRLKD